MQLAAGHYAYRPLKRGDQGYDVYAAQTALPGLDTDGTFGPLTEGEVERFQAAKGLEVDGIAGIATQSALALSAVWPQQKTNRTPPGLLRGQVEAESGFQLGNHTSPYSDATRDVGVCQIHVDPTATNLRVAFDVPRSVARLAVQLRTKRDAYIGEPGAQTERRAWELAAGSWNAPAWADRAAAGGSLSEAQSQQLEAYIARVTKYMQI